MKATQYIDEIEAATGAAELESIELRALRDPEVKRSTNTINSICHALCRRRNKPVCEL